MPRKKKKGIPMPPLEFVHSPLYQDAPIVTCFDLGNSNTATARTVGVDELDNFPWVSPQFRSKTTIQMYSRNKKTTKTFTRLRSKSESSPGIGFSEIKSKFPPLHFVQTSSFSKEQHVRKNTTPARKEQDSDQGQQNVLREMEDTSDHCNNQTQGSPHVENFAIFQEDFLNVKTPTLMEKTSERCLLHSRESSPLVECHNKTQLDIRSTSLDSDEEEYSDSGECEIAVLDKTRQKHESERKHSKIIRKNERQIMTRNFSFPPLEHSNNRNLLQHLSTPAEAENDTDVPAFSAWHWQPCTPTQRSSHVEILVADTPERYYGVSMRQRQLEQL